jgi:signal transduction histidine kinase
MDTEISQAREIQELQTQRAREAKIYQKLYEIGKSLNETMEIPEIYDLAIAFATNELQFEKCIIFEHDDANGWFKVVKSFGYHLPHEQQILKIINLLLSGEVIEYLRVHGKPLVYTQKNPKEQVAKLVKSLFLNEAYFELFGGDVEIPHGVIVIGNGVDLEGSFSSMDSDEMVMLALGNFTTRLSSAVSNTLFYKAWNEERKNLQKALLDQKQLNVKLDTEQKKLEQALVVAENAARVKGEFLANMSHEIRTPMNGILGFIQLFERTNLDEKQKHFVSIMHTSAKTLLGIINDILDVSKLESGKFELDITEVNPFSECEKASMIFMPKIKEKEIEFSREIDPNIDTCLKLDLLRMQQIVSNLLGNAIKFTPQKGKILLYIKLLEKTEQKSTLRVGVKDSGIGISKESQEHIFEAFSQAAISTTRKFGGTGLGLTICSRLVTLMGGVLKVESQEGEGSHFFFDIEVESC